MVKVTQYEHACNSDTVYTEYLAVFSIGFLFYFKIMKQENYYS